VSYFLRLRPELVEDAHEAFVWYEAAAIGLGHEFLRSYFVALAEIEREPLICLRVFQGFRRKLLERFPYVIYFRVERDNIMVFLLIHAARNPSLIQRSLRRRKTAVD
jgi:hypothetical protein